MSASVAEASLATDTHGEHSTEASGDLLVAEAQIRSLQEELTALKESQEKEKMASEALTADVCKLVQDKAELQAQLVEEQGQPSNRLKEELARLGQELAAAEENIRTAEHANQCWQDHTNQLQADFEQKEAAANERCAELAKELESMRRQQVTSFSGCMFGFEFLLAPEFG